jgi:uncharacterized membrane protein
MTRASRGWLLIGFAIALVGAGFEYWQTPYGQLSLPDALYGPPLVAVAVVAMLLRAFGVARFLTAWLLIAASVPAAVLVRVVVEVIADPSTHNLWPFEIAIAAGLGAAAALAGTLVGSLFLLRSRRRP